MNPMNSETLVPDPKFVAVDKEGKPADVSVLDEADIAYDPAKMTMDLTRAQKRRVTALMLAIQAYDHLIIKDAEMYNAISRDADRKGGPVIQPATMDAMVMAAINFDRFIAGEFSIPTATPQAQTLSDSEQPTTDPEEEVRR